MIIDVTRNYNGQAFAQLPQQYCRQHHIREPMLFVLLSSDTPSAIKPRLSKIVDTITTVNDNLTDDQRTTNQLSTKANNKTAVKVKSSRTDKLLLSTNSHDDENCSDDDEIANDDTGQRINTILTIDHNTDYCGEFQIPGTKYRGYRFRVVLEQKHDLKKIDNIIQRYTTVKRIYVQDDSDTVPVPVKLFYILSLCHNFMHINHITYRY